MIAICGVKRSGKDTLAEILKSKIPSAEVYHFADHLKDLVCQKYGVTRQELEELKVQDTVFRDGMTMRQILQTWGTNDVVTYDQMYWVQALMRLIDKEKPKCPIIADLRFDHELQYLKEHHWFLVKIEYNVHTDNHVSETEQLGFNPSDFAFVINNNNHSANLDLEADKLLEVYRSQRGQR